MRLLFLLFLFTPLSIFGAQVGIVTAKKAVIYSDIELKSPIGFIRKGRQLAVGNVKRRRGEVLPVVVNGRIGWVKVRDLRLPEEEKLFDAGKKITEHEVIIEDKIKDPLDQNNFVTLRTGPSGVGLTANSQLNGEINSDLESAVETSLMFEHKNPYRYMHWGMGVEFFQAEAGLYSFKSLNLKGGVSFVPIRLSWASIEGYANILLSGDFRVQSSNVGEYKGNMFGADYGAMVRLLPEYKIGLVVGAGLTYFKFSGLSDIQNSEDDDLISFSTMSGTKVFAGISYRF